MNEKTKIKLAHKNNRNESKDAIKIGSWNIRTLLPEGTMEEIGRQMKIYEIEVLALQEIRWAGEGRIDKETYSLWYGGGSKRGQYGTAFMVGNNFKEKVTEFERVNDRISYIKITRTETESITIINAYAPTDVTKRIEKNKFYENLEEVCENLPKRHTVLLLGDFNAKLGKEEFLKTVAGKETIHEVTTDNGIRLSFLAAQLGMFIVSTKFKHIKEHKITWISPGGISENQIDHVLIKKERQKDIKDVRSFKVESVNSDHFLLIVKMKLNGSIKQIIQNKNEWFDTECEIILEKQQQARINWVKTKKQEDWEEYKSIRKELKRTINNKKAKWIPEKITDIEYDNKYNGKLYQHKRKQKKKENITTDMEDDGTSSKMDEKEIEEEYTHQENGAETQEPTVDEFVEVIKELTNEKAMNSDEIWNEMVRDGEKEMRDRMYDTITHIWRTEIMPNEWQLENLTLIPKSEDLKKYQNYRQIMFMNTTYRIFTALLLKRIHGCTETILGEYQNGFRQEKSAVDAKHVITQIIEKCHNYNIDTHILFVDFTKILNINIILNDAKTLGMPKKLTRLIKIVIENARATIQTCEGMVNEMQMYRGMRVRDYLSTLLLNIAIEGIVSACNLNGSITEETSQIVAYVDELVLISKNQEALEDALLKISSEAGERGLEINVEKTKYMKITKSGKTSDVTEIKIGKYTFEEVGTFNYLGTLISNENNRKLEIIHRVLLGYEAYYDHKTLIKNKKLSRYSKFRIYQALIRSVVLYGAETMCFKENVEEKLRTFEDKVLSKIFNSKKLMQEEINDILKEKDIIGLIKSKRIRWYKKLYKKGEQSVLGKITNWKQEANRSRGRPKINWKDQVMKDVK